MKLKCKCGREVKMLYPGDVGPCCWQVPKKFRPAELPNSGTLKQTRKRDIPMVCPHCGVSFMACSNRQIYCSPKHWYEATKKEHNIRAYKRKLAKQHNLEVKK